MVVSTNDIKQYMKINHDEDDNLIRGLILASEALCVDIVRRDINDVSTAPIFKIAVMYAVAYLYQYREDADYKKLSLMLRALLQGIRRSEF